MGAMDPIDAHEPIASIESEQAVLGALMLDSDVYDRIGGQIATDDFTLRDHRLIYTAIKQLVLDQRRADVVTVFERLQATGAKIKRPLQYLNEIVQSTPGAANVERYAEIMRNRSLLRGCLRAAKHVMELCHHTGGREPADIIDQAQSAFLHLSDADRRKDDGFMPMLPTLSRVVERIDMLYQREDKGGVTGTATGFDDLDRRLDGMHEGELIIVGGRPSMGKTSLAMNIAENVATRSGLPAAVVSMEMPAEQLATRMLASISRVNQHRLRTGSLEDSDWSRITHGVRVMSEANLHILEGSSLTPSMLRTRLRRLHREHGQLGVVVIDYLQLMSGDGASTEMRAVEVSGISRALKQIATELRVPVIALSQLNRGLEQRPNKRPVMSDLRESGSIEQDADVILFIYRDEVYNPDSPDTGTAEIIIAKQRNGPIGTVRLAFKNATTRFENFAEPGEGY
ncbi:MULTISPECIES: replicative DNA helicase [Burkholderia]|uniref:Replicative DNA helicase n=1 Tax=Burkholderia savannae TaxID=1637837 RepID=A0ABR5TCU9_9BURK|nr:MULTISPECIES: replicative DNA helicase [Burkholderia]AOJ68404.1 replicative DNA helicase [Burkholderia savannae]KVG79460.1 replicative DNA helicase [Burkholderia sp. MSMB2040]KWZ42800.1 replicative DNA helicase [Burkholderia savannae]